MTITIGNIVNVAYGNRTDTTISKPTGLNVGDLLVMIHTMITLNTSVPTTISTPTGWTRYGADQAEFGQFSPHNSSSVYFYRTVDGTEPADWTITHTATNTRSSATIITFIGDGVLSLGSQTRAARTTSPYSASEPATVASITTTKYQEMALLFCINWDEVAFAPPSGATERVDSQYHYISTKEFATPGATGTMDTTNSSTNGPWYSSATMIQEAQYTIASPENTTYGHDGRGDTAGVSTSQAYTLGDARADRIVAVFFMLDGANTNPPSNMKFKISGQSDIVPTLVGAPTNNHQYIAYAVCPLGTSFTFEANVDTGLGGLLMEFVFSFYGCPSGQFDTAGVSSASASITGVDREADGTVIAWAFGNSAVVWGGTSPVMVSIATRSGIFGARFAGVGVELNSGAQTNTTISVASAQRIVVLCLGAAAPPATAKENSGLHHIECGSPMGKKTNGILHPIRHGIVGERVTHTRRAA